MLMIWTITSRGREKLWKLSGTAMVSLAILATGLVLPDSSRADSPHRAAVSTTQGFNWHVASDDRRYFAYQRRSGTPVVVDSFTNRTRRIKGADGCDPMDIGGGRVLLNCSRARITGKTPGRLARTAPVTGGKAVRIRKSGGMIYDQIGRFWVGGGPYCDTRPGCGLVYQNWRTGQKRGFGFADPDAYDPNLDSRKLRPRAEPPPFETGPRADRVVWNKRVLITDNGTHLRLWRLGKPSKVIGPSIGFCCGYGRDENAVHLGAGKFTYVAGKRFHSVSISNLKRHKGQVSGYGSSVAPLRGGVVLANVRSKKFNEDQTRFSVRTIRFR